MLAAAQQTAAVTLTASADATELVKLREQYRTGATDSAAKIPSYTALLVKLVSEALGRHPNLLHQWTGEGIEAPNGVHIAIAVDTPSGLMTPVLRDVPTLSLAQISVRLSDLISRARDRRLLPEELQGGTFTLTNLGGYRVDAFTPLLNLPQSSILGVGRIAPQPVVVEGCVEVRDRVTLSLTFDHRAADGAAAAALLTTI
jgi:pyruvate dehydrogenase E2 component (dihydrolipoamide acetyltransferase)